MYLRNFIFGVEDSLVSTVGFLAGVAVAGAGRETLWLTGLILILVEAFSMAAGSFLSEYSAEEYLTQKEMPAKNSLGAALIMFFSYAGAGLIPLAPYLLLNAPRAILFSVALSLTALFLLGAGSGKALRANFIRSGLRMLLVGGIAISAGIAAGYLLKTKG